MRENVSKRKKYPVSNPDILKFFEREDTKEYLKDIYDGVIPSERHDIVCSMLAKGRWDAGIYTKIFRLASAQFLEDDGNIDKQLWSTVSKMFERVDLKRIRGCTFSTNFYEMAAVESDMHKYVFYVFVPEGIVKYIQDINSWDRDQAENYYVNVESRVSQEELDDFDEEIALDQVREQERLKREKEAERDQREAERINENNNDIDFELPDLDVDETNASVTEAVSAGESEDVDEANSSFTASSKNDSKILNKEKALDVNNGGSNSPLKSPNKNQTCLNKDVVKYETTSVLVTIPKLRNKESFEVAHEIVVTPSKEDTEDVPKAQLQSSQKLKTEYSESKNSAIKTIDIVSPNQANEKVST